MSQRPRTPAEIAAAVEQGLNRGLNLVDSLTAATSHRSLSREHRKALNEYRRNRTTYVTRRESARIAMIAGGLAIAGSLALGLLTASPIYFLGVVPAGALGALGVMSWRRLGSPPRELAPVPPVSALPRKAIGRAEVNRYLNVRTQVMTVHGSIKSIHPDAARELRAADSAAAPALNALVERLAVLHELRIKLPNSAAANTAETACLAISERLQVGCENYDVLLSACATLMATPELESNTQLQTAAESLIAYSYGLTRAADL